MKIILSGFNSDKDSLHSQNPTPETVSAAYARISRSEKDIPELRKEAASDIEKARKSNETIVFGLGHSSIAEHAVFNFDIMGISRAAIEHIQSHRLASYTEKSQRYVSFETGYHIPEEISGDKKVLSKYKSFCDECFRKYREAQDFLSKRSLAKTEVNEDARYFLPLSAYTQCGMTVNGRTLEYMISDLRSQDSSELRNIGGELLRQVEGIAPSIIKYTEGREIFRKRFSPVKYRFPEENISFVSFSAKHEGSVASAMDFSRMGRKYNPSRKINTEENIFSQLFLSMNEYDRPPREFEMSDATFVVYCSASCFAQLKRHRMSTVIPQPYSLKETPYIPLSFAGTPLAESIKQISEMSKKTDASIRRSNPFIMQYAAVNASKRAVLLKMNARELYHFVRLRSDKHAQLEIREISDKIAEAAIKAAPGLYSYLCGKDKFRELKK